MEKPKALYYKKDDDTIEMCIMKETFADWYHMLLTSCRTHNEDLGSHPLGSCLERDIIRDRKVKNANV